MTEIQNSARRLRLPILIIILMMILAVLGSQHTSLHWFVQNEQWLRAAIKANPIKSHIIVFFAYLIVSLVPGMAGKSIVLGWLFGLISGVLIVNTALAAAAVTTFLLCRYYLQSVVLARLGPYLAPIQRRLNNDGAFYLLTLRLAHAPFSIMNYAAGSGTSISLRTFWWTTQLGLLPGNIVFVFAGTRLPGLDVLVRQGPLSLLDGPLIVALASTAILPWLARRLIKFMPPTGNTAQQLPFQPADDEAVKEK